MATIELIYLTEQEQFQQCFEVTLPMTVRALIEQSQILERFNDLNLETLSVGIFSKKVALETELQDGDRVEIYRELTIDPKEARRLRTQKKANRE